MARGPRNRVGPWVSGEDFWNREAELESLIRFLDDDHDVLLIAPRRVGKTSLVRQTLLKLEERGRDYCVFVDLEDDASPEEAIVALSLATRPLQPLWKKVTSVFASRLKGVAARIEEIGIDELTLRLRQAVAGDWRASGDRLLEGLARADRPLIICFDELPVMLNRVLRERGPRITPEGRRTADLFLSWLRQAMQANQGRIRFIVCGSIGLEPIVRMAGLSHTIAHLRPFRLDAWPRDVADSFLARLAEGYQVPLSADLRGRMLDLIGWCVPHHVQMFFGYVETSCRRLGARSLDVAKIEGVYRTEMLGPCGHAELADYEERLLRVLGEESRPLALVLLTEAAVVGELTFEAGRILARACQPATANHENDLRVVLDVLLHDGYLREKTEQVGVFCFVSDLIRDWWRKRHGDGHVPAVERLRMEAGA